MDRRSFLKAVLATPVAIALAPLLPGLRAAPALPATVIGTWANADDFSDWLLLALNKSTIPMDMTAVRYQWQEDAVQIR